MITHTTNEWCKPPIKDTTGYGGHIRVRNDETIDVSRVTSRVTVLHLGKPPEIRGAIRTRAYNGNDTFRSDAGGTVQVGPWRWGGDPQDCAHAEWLLSRFRYLVEKVSGHRTPLHPTAGRFGVNLWALSLGGAHVPVAPDWLPSSLGRQGHFEWVPNVQARRPEFVELWDMRAAYTAMLRNVTLAQPMIEAHETPQPWRRNAYGVRIPHVGWMHPWEAGLVGHDLCDMELVPAAEEGRTFYADCFRRWESWLPLDDADADVARMARMVVLATIGTFARKQGSVEVRTPIGEMADDWTPSETSRIEGGHVVDVRLTGKRWDYQPLLAWDIWGRCRARLLSGPGVSGKTGALHLPRGSVVALRADGIWVDKADSPQWPDDGKRGRFRLSKTVYVGGKWPTSLADLA